jgi:hypothetical protein
VRAGRRAISIQDPATRDRRAKLVTVVILHAAVRNRRVASYRAVVDMNW